VEEQKDLSNGTHGFLKGRIARWERRVIALETRSPVQNQKAESLENKAAAN
jgi:hypothetical protein